MPRFNVTRIGLWTIFILLTLLSVEAVTAGTLTDVCPSGGIQPRIGSFQPGGIILTTFDRASMWVYNITTDRRYPLPETYPCGTNCRLSRDARWITYVDSETNAYAKMRLDGTERTQLVDYAADVEWWSDDMLLVWTPGHEAYLRAENGTDREYLDVEGVVSIQPGGRWGLLVKQDGDTFSRALVDLETRDLQGIAGGYIDLGEDKPYFSAASWSPDGQWFAYVAPTELDAQANSVGSEIFGIRPGDSLSTQWTELTTEYGAVRINGRADGEMSWAPDSRRIAFWVIEMLGSDPESNTGNAVLHILNVNTGELQRYCGFSTTEHTPNPPRLVWSPNGTHIAFGGNVPGDDKGYLLLAIDTTTGVFTALSDGIYPSFGGANVIAWGLPPA
jgi:hypothetical protein